ncbi:hypothetical protein [Draconibacterium sp.]|uniref:hypothetical protein n=1 Tax=Draconibacterium sp. TaxID=1965318 RepID=UPI0035676B76
MKKITIVKKRLFWRILVLIPVFIILFLAYFRMVLIRTWHFFLYGGEWVNFEKPERENINDIFLMLQEMHNNESADILKRLVELKDYKDKYGKDEHYQKLQPKLWMIAREKLKILSK